MLAIFQSLRSHEGFRRYFHNTSWLFVEQILRLIAGLLVGIWVARYLGPAQFGLFSYVLAFTAIFSGIAKLGLDVIMVRELVLEPDKRDVYLGTAFWLKIFGAFIAFGLILIATIFTSNNSTTNLYIVIIAGGMLFQSFEVIDFFFQAKVLSRFVSLCKMSQLLLSSLLKIWFVLSGADLFWFVLVSLFDQVTLAISLAIAHRFQKLGGFYCCFDVSTAVRLLKDSWFLILSSLMAMIYLRIDQIMIKEMLGVREVGIYASAVRLSEVWYFLPVIVTNSVYPAILSAKKISEELYNSRLQTLYTLMIWTAIGIAVPMTFLSTWLVTFLYGEAYKDAGLVLMINIWSGIFVFLSAAFGKYLITENLAKINFYRTAWGAALNIVLNYIFINIYGVKGAALSTLISLAVINIAYDIFDKKLHAQLKLKLYAFAYPLWRK